MAIRLLEIAMTIGFVSVPTAPGDAVTDCLVPVPPASVDAKLLVSYREMVEAYTVCVEAQLSSWKKADGGSGSQTIVIRKADVDAERAQVFENLRRYESELERAFAAH